MPSSLRAVASLDVAAPVDDVFAYVSDPRNMSDWVVGVENVHLENDGPTAVGTRFVSDYRYGGRVHEMAYEVTGYETPRRYAIRGEGPFPFEGELTLDATPTGTRVTNALEAGSDGRVTSLTFTLLAPLVRRVMAKRLREELVQLGEAVTSPPTSPTTA